MPVIPALRRLRQLDGELRTRLGYRYNLTQFQNKLTAGYRWFMTVIPATLGVLEFKPQYRQNKQTKSPEADMRGPVHASEFGSNWAAQTTYQSVTDAKLQGGYHGKQGFRCLQQTKVLSPSSAARRHREAGG
jgi:hypothetical protein